MPSTKVLITTAVIVLAVMYAVNHFDFLKGIVEG